TDEQVDRLRADGYRVEVHEDADELAIERSADVAPEADRFSPPPAGGTTGPDRQGPAETVPGDRRPASGATLELLMDLSDVAEGTGREAPSADEGDRAVLGGYLTATEVESALAVLAATHPALASVAPLPQPTEEGRTS